MADNSSIEWTDATWNPIRGCSRVSEGCRHCYAEGVAARFSGPGQPYEGLAKRVTRPDGGTEARWTGKMTQAPEATLTQPLRWKKPRMIFVNSMSDLFHEAVPDEWIDRVFAVMAMSPQHVFQCLTKRPERAAKYTNGLLTTSFPADRIARALETIAPGRKVNVQWPLPNVWIGTSVEDQVRGAERLSQLRDVWTAVRWVSFEPLLGPVYARNIELPYERFDALAGLRHLSTGEVRETGRIHWAVIGGESGPGARPMHPDWARSLREQCAAAGTAFFFKQWGAWIDADQIADRLAGSNDAYIVRDGARWNPARPLNYADAAFLAGVFGHPFEHQSDGRTLFRLGKTNAGRLLDGIEHNSMPETAS